MTDSEYYKLLQNYKTIMIFGTTRQAVSESEFIKKMGIHLNAFIVSNNNVKQFDELEGIPVRSFEEISEEEKKECVLIGRDLSKNEESTELLKSAGFSHVFPGLCQLKTSLDKKEIDNIICNFNGKLIGKAKTERTNDDIINASSHIRIYEVTSHKNIHRLVQSGWDSPFIERIQAGAALTDERICKITDDTGENISLRNQYYCELTAGYWIAKNDTLHDWLGLYHYSRGLSIGDEELSCLSDSDIDCILPSPYKWQYDTASFCASEIILSAIQAVSPEYIDAAEQYFMSRFMVAGNILIARRPVFCEYYDWLMDICQEMECRLNETKSLEKRMIGYLAEDLLNIYFMKNANRFQIAFSPMKQFKTV